MELTKEIIKDVYKKTLNQDIREQDLNTIQNYSLALFEEFKKLQQQEIENKIKEGILSKIQGADVPIKSESQELTDKEINLMRLVAIGTAALGYWKSGDSIHPNYVTITLQDVANLYKKYDDLYKLNEKKIATINLPEKITLEHVTILCDSAVSISYHLFPDTFHTTCCIKLQNGATVIGESVCASSSIFNEKLGRDYALENAMEKLWTFEGYSLCEKRFQAGLDK